MKLLNLLSKVKWPSLPKLPKFGLPSWAKKAVPYEIRVPYKPVLPAVDAVIERRAIVTSGNSMCYVILSDSGDPLRVELWVKGQKIGVLSPQECIELVALLDRAVGLPYAH